MRPLAVASLSIDPDFENHRAHALTDGVIEPDHRFETQCLAMQVDDELAEIDLVPMPRGYTTPPSEIGKSRIERARARHAATLGHVGEVQTIYPYRARRCAVGLQRVAVVSERCLWCAATSAAMAMVWRQRAREIFDFPRVTAMYSSIWLLQHRQRHRAVRPAPHRGTRAGRSARRAPSLRACAQLEDLELAHLVGERLARPGDVAIGLGAHFVERQRRVGRRDSRIACSRVQPMACMPVSTTSRQARHIS